MSMKEPGQHQIWESSPAAQPLKDVPVIMANNCTIEVATSACIITTDLSPTQMKKFSSLTLEVDNLPRMTTPSPEIEKDTYLSVHSKTVLEEQRAPSRKSKWMRLMRMQLNSMRAQKLQQQAGRRSPETDKPRSEHLSVRRDAERHNSTDERVCPSNLFLNGNNSHRVPESSWK
ncbi:unnamed protein product [Dibothriocephalus latus]|uniref:Uncharacterized protein n=1 Tax=Dibothriocephalus latus TaxID=60516 RepID=A0A3P6S748_DIBLA|nr:unnamed protein product [Dibothriocephalus latus]